MHFNGLNSSGALKEFLLLHNFWAQKCKNQFFEENEGFECSFFELKYRGFQTRLADL